MSGELPFPHLQPILHGWLAMHGDLQTTELLSLSTKLNGGVLDVHLSFRVERKVLCPVCEGAGQIKEDGGALAVGVPCDGCQGTGFVLGSAT